MGALNWTFYIFSYRPGTAAIFGHIPIGVRAALVDQLLLECEEGVSVADFTQVLGHAPLHAAQEDLKQHQQHHHRKPTDPALTTPHSPNLQGWIEWLIVSTCLAIELGLQIKVVVQPLYDPWEEDRLLRWVLCRSILSSLLYIHTASRVHTATCSQFIYTKLGLLSACKVCQRPIIKLINVALESWG
jgi:hypothetical protein